MKDGTCGDCPLYRVKMHCAVDYGEDAHECTPRRKWREVDKLFRSEYAYCQEIRAERDTLRSDLDLAEGTITDIRAQLEEALHKSSHSYAMKLEAKLEEAEAMLSDAERRLLEHRARAEQAEAKLEEAERAFTKMENGHMESEMAWKARAEQAEAKLAAIFCEICDDYDEDDQIPDTIMCRDCYNKAGQIAIEAMARVKELEESLDVRRHELTDVYARVAELEEALRAIQHCVDEQADDEGLWLLAPTAAEAYVQEGLRRLHACVENVAILSRYHAAEADLRIAAEQQGAQELAARCASLEEALEHAMAAVWDSYYGKGISLAYVHEVDRIARQALKGKGSA